MAVKLKRLRPYRLLLVTLDLTETVPETTGTGRLTPLSRSTELFSAQ